MGYDLAIIGLGAMGSAALYQAAKAGANVIGFDRYDPPHALGSSHAEPRVTRLAVGEGTQYLPLVARSHEIWRELEQETGERLLFQPGGLIIAPRTFSTAYSAHWDNFVERTAAVARAGNVPFYRQSAEQTRSAFPALRLRDDEQVGFEPSAGVVLCEKAVVAQLRRARGLGATIRPNTPIHALDLSQTHSRIQTNDGWVTAEKIILASGAWLNDLLPNLPLTVTRQVVYWFEPENSAAFSAERFPIVIWMRDRPSPFFFGVFPIPPGGIPGVKFLTEQFEVDTDPRSVDRVVSSAEIEQFYEQYVRDRMNGITPNCLKAAACLYTSTADNNFIIDHHPDSGNVVVVSACSGHGFKHSAAVGELAAAFALSGERSAELEQFRL